MERGNGRWRGPDDPPCRHSEGLSFSGPGMGIRLTVERTRAAKRSAPARSKQPSRSAVLIGGWRFSPASRTMVEVTSFSNSVHRLHGRRPPPSCVWLSDCSTR